ncbi:cmgc srpk kinase [Fusarium longipes]|uniref:Cmgc srpk kinase n=1 Tax=Fusarium longipes TaxID=694270 RepID=A0A395RN82_9HYPO|nr:cmgc srpk kinase [Fusarium longipes]
MNGTQSPDPQKASNANSNGSNSNNSSLAAKKRKKDLKPIITMEGANQTDGCTWSLACYTFEGVWRCPWAVRVEEDENVMAIVVVLMAVRFTAT